MKLQILVGVIIGGVFFTSCTHTRGKQLDQILASWQGYDPEQLVKRWGAPTGTYTLRDGGEVLTYQHNRMSSRMSFYRYPENYSDSFTCKISFYTDSQRKKIINSSFQGDASTCLEIATPAQSSANTDTNTGPNRME